MESGAGVMEIENRINGQNPPLPRIAHPCNIRFKELMLLRIYLMLSKCFCSFLFPLFLSMLFCQQAVKYSVTNYSLAQMALPCVVLNCSQFCISVHDVDVMGLRIRFQIVL